MHKTTYAWAPVIVAALVMGGCSKKEEKEVEAPAPVQVTAVTQDTIRRVIAGDGVLFPKDQQNVMPKITAPVKRFLVNRGDHVREGQLLAVLENKDLTAQAGESKGALDQAESNLRATQGATLPEAVVKAQTDVEAAKQTVDAAKRALESRQELFKQGALPRRQVDEQQVNWAQANSNFLSAQEHLRALQSVSKDEQIKQAQAQVESARQHYESVQAQVQYSEVHSPLNGVVADRPLWAGDVASTGIPLFVIMDISRVVARINVPQGQATLVKVGQPGEITITETGEKMDGKVTVVSPATDAASTTVQVWIEIANPGEKLKPGASVHAKVVAETFKNATVVPSSAILPGEEGGTAVLVISSDSVAHRRPVQLGVREGNKVQLLNGANPGEEVVVVGGMGIDDKAKVKVVDTTVKEADDEDENPEPPPAAGKDQKKDEANKKK